MFASNWNHIPIKKSDNNQRPVFFWCLQLRDNCSSSVTLIDSNGGLIVFPSQRDICRWCDDLLLFIV